MTDMTTTVPDGLTLCANWYATRAHYAPIDGLVPASRRAMRPGLRGPALCGNDVFDQVHHDMTTHGKPKDLATLPLCKKCGRAAAKLGGAS